MENTVKVFLSLSFASRTTVQEIHAAFDCGGCLIPCDEGCNRVQDGKFGGIKGEKYYMQQHEVPPGTYMLWTPARK